MTIQDIALFASPHVPLAQAQPLLLRHHCRVAKVFAEVLDPVQPTNALLQQWIADCVAQRLVHFVALGGDGTLHLLGNALQSFTFEHHLPAGVTLGCVGWGSSNDFVKDNRGNCVPRLDWQQAQPQLLARVMSTDHQCYAFVGTSIGLTAYANHLFNAQRGQARFLVALRIISCALQAWIKFQPFPATLIVDDQRHRVSLSNLGLASQQAFAGSFRYDRLPPSGKIGLWLCLGLSRWQALGTMVRFARAKFREDSAHIYQDCTHMTLDADREFLIETDGETFISRHLRVVVEWSRIAICPRVGPG